MSEDETLEEVMKSAVTKDGKGGALHSRFLEDRELVARVIECSEVYLVCKNGAKDKTIHFLPWLKSYL